jgi:hypothetical protein
MKRVRVCSIGYPLSEVCAYACANAEHTGSEEMVVCDMMPHKA